MYRFANPYTVTLLAIAALMFALAVVTARSRHSRRVAVPLAGFLAAVGLWAFADGVRIAAPTAAHVLFWNKVAYLGIVGIPPTYFFFIAAITNREHWFQWRYVGGMVGISLFAYGLVLTNPWHGLWHASKTVSPGTEPPVVTETWGPLWYPWVVYGSGLVVGTGIYFLAAEVVRSSRSRLYRSQVALVLVAVLVPWVANIEFVAIELVAVDPLPFTLPVTGVGFAVAIFRFDLLDIRPIARDVVVDQVDAGVLVCDARDTVVDANDRAIAVLGLDASAVPGIALDDALADEPEIAERLRGTRDESEVVTVGTDDGRRHYEVDVSPIEDDLGTYLGRAVVFTDVTERIDREMALRDRTARLRRKNERLDELAAVVSHDLRNPLEVSAQRARRLRTIVDDADLSEETLSAIEAEIDGIERATGRATDISRDLLTISRDAGDDGDQVGPPADPDAAGERAVVPGGTDEDATVSLRSVATDAWDTVETGDLDLSIRGSRPVDADVGDLRRLLENCFRNVVDHADGATTVVVGATGDGFYVEDDGPGLPEGTRDRALERGYSTLSRSSGLGLAIVADVADAHGWTVELTASDAGGARVEVELDPE